MQRRTEIRTAPLHQLPVSAAVDVTVRPDTVPETVRVADRLGLPVAGVKVTMTVQVPPLAATVLPAVQVPPVTTKLAALVPEIAGAESNSPTVLVLVTVSVCV